ncbi:hypothetical protein [Yersinia kristensenii]|uniref:hypothetical protein n=1 Tax=Yersinia kristensenii TaxID=28152 RepID=UPI00187BE881
MMKWRLGHKHAKLKWGADPQRDDSDWFGAVESVFVGIGGKLLMPPPWVCWRYL